ncbi:MAG: ATPase [Deltaproteobacteria bacterium HGW-Deltaproteobacteria-12]|nr:MAG: ATPase [Deltaproteobacteria bacterium HGW-Deltaproteobacteria-12]
MKFHSFSVAEAFTRLGSTQAGLPEEKAVALIESAGFNEITETEKEPAWKKLLGQFANLLILILIIASIISALMGDIIEAISIVVIVLLAGILGFIQEYQAQKAIESLKKMAAHKALVVRNGIEHLIEARLLVPGDVVVLKTGDTIPADARLIEAANLTLEEAALTGESQGVMKNAEMTFPENCSVGDRLNMVYAGTSISNGRGKALICATGSHTEFGKIADMLQKEPEKKTPLQQNLDALGSRIGVFALVIAVLMSAAGILKGYELVKMFIWGVALAVAVIPEALPAVVTISLALGVRRMVKRRALVRKLPAVETLGAVNIICSDKTGTLTEDQMTVRKLYIDGAIVSVTGAGYEPAGELKVNGEALDTGNAVFAQLVHIGSLCNDSHLVKKDKWLITGDPTEGALVVLAAKAGLNSDELRGRITRIAEDPFSSEKKRMTTYHSINNETFAYSKGAGEVMLGCSTQIMTAQGVIALTDETRMNLQQTIRQFAEDSLRVIGFAYKKIDSFLKAQPEEEMIFVGFVGMIDPPRPEVFAAIRRCENAGIRPVMITGDHKITAIAIAREIGILKDGAAYSGEEIESMSDDDLNRAVTSANVFARISPAHKYSIVEALMAQGNIVAMTGDGVNDAPTLKKANIGIAMGITGTDVSKEASDMILTDDNFASIVSAVEEGRTIFENIRKYLVYLLSGNMGTVLGIIIAMAAGLPLPLTAVQILFINFVMDGLVAIALGVEAPEPGIMDKKPRTVKEGILNTAALSEILLVGIWIGLLTMAVYAYALHTGAGDLKAGTLFFTALVFARLVNGFACRSLHQSLFLMHPFSNRALIASILITLIMVIGMINLPALQTIFGLTYLVNSDWLLVTIMPLTLLAFTEAVKWIKRKIAK